MENYTEKILSMYSNINFSQEIRELFDDIQTINIMIINLQNNRYIDEERLEEIENKYQNEISMLANLEKIYNHRNPIDKRNYTLSEYLYSFFIDSKKSTFPVFNDTLAIKIFLSMSLIF